MPRVVSTTATGPVGSPGGATLRALMDRRKELQERQAASQGQPIEHWMQGVGNLAQQAVAGFQERGVRRQEEEGRQALAQAVSGVDPSTGIASQEQLATMMQMDPEVGLAFVKQAIEARRAQAAEATRLAERKEGRGWDVQDAASAAAATAASREDQQAFTAGQQANQQQFQAGQTANTQTFQAGQQEDQQAAATETARLAREAELAKAAATPQTDVGKLAADLAAGRIDQPTYDAAVKKATTQAGVGGPQNLKVLYDQQDQFINTSSGISQLQKAQKLLEQGIDWGNFVGTRNWAGQYGSEEAKALADRTKEYNAIMNTEAIAAMSQQLKGATTDTEMAQFIKNMNDPALDPTVKKTQIDTMMARAQAFQEQQAARIKTMDPTWEPPAPKTTSPADEQALLQGARDAIAKGADAALVRKRLVDKGIDPGKL